MKRPLISLILSLSFLSSYCNAAYPIPRNSSNTDSLLRSPKSPSLRSSSPMTKILFEEPPERPETPISTIQRESAVYNHRGRSFEKFLRWLDEKPIIASQILKTLRVQKDSLLDIGSGDGTLTMLIESLFNRITVIEPGPLFKTLCKKCSSKKYTPIRASFEEVELGSNQFDVILASHVFRYIVKDSEAVLYKQLQRVKNLLKSSGLFLLIDLDKDCDYWEFHRIYRPFLQKDLGKEICDPFQNTPDYQEALEQIFQEVTPIHFSATLSIPERDDNRILAIDNLLSIFDLIYDIEDFSVISRETLIAIRNALFETYGNGPIEIEFQQTMYVCQN